MAFAGVGVALRFRPAVVPRTILNVVIAHRTNGRRVFRKVRRLVLNIPDNQRRIIAPFIHPGEDFRREGFLGAAIGAAAKNGVFVHNQHAFFIGNVIPDVRRKANVETERIPVHVLKLLIERARPVGIKGMVCTERILIEAVHGDIGAIQIMHFAIQHGKFCIRIKVESAHTKAVGIRVAVGDDFDLIQEGVTRSPELVLCAILDGDRIDVKFDAAVGRDSDARFRIRTNQFLLLGGFPIFIDAQLIDVEGDVRRHIGVRLVFQCSAGLDGAIFQIGRGLQCSDRRIVMENQRHAVDDSRIEGIALAIGTNMRRTVGIVSLLDVVPQHNDDFVFTRMEIRGDVGVGRGVVVLVVTNILSIHIDVAPIVCFSNA